MAIKRCLWESDFQWNARRQFIETWRDSFPEDRLAALSMVWANMKFLGCRYPTSTEDIVIELESKAPICLPERAVRKRKSIIANFSIYEPEEQDESANNNPLSILNESSQKSKKNISYEDLGRNDETGRYSCTVTIGDKTIAVGYGDGKKQAKRNAAEEALAILRPCQPIVRVRSHQHDSARCVTRSDLVSKAYEESPNISIDNIGNQMLRKMGWTGSGGIGKECQGRVEPVMALGTDGRFGLGHDSTVTGSAVTKVSVKDVLMTFISGPDQEIRFSNELSKEDRVVVHKISQQYGLKHRSYGKGHDRYLVVGKS